MGLSNEQCICVFGVASGEIAPCRETGEEITARWYSRGELREMLKSCTFGSWRRRTATCGRGLLAQTKRRKMDLHLEMSDSEARIHARVSLTMRGEAFASHSPPRSK